MWFRANPVAVALERSPDVSVLTERSSKTATPFAPVVCVTCPSQTAAPINCTVIFTPTAAATAAVKARTEGNGVMVSPTSVLLGCVMNASVATPGVVTAIVNSRHRLNGKRSVGGLDVNEYEPRRSVCLRSGRPR